MSLFNRHLEKLITHIFPTPRSMSSCQTVSTPVEDLDDGACADVLLCEVLAEVVENLQVHLTQCGAHKGRLWGNNTTDNEVLYNDKHG